MVRNSVLERIDPVHKPRKVIRNHLEEVIMHLPHVVIHVLHPFIVGKDELVVFHRVECA